MKFTRVAATLLATAMGSALVAPMTAQAATADKTSTVEARRVDRVKTPKLSWFDCYGSYQCASAMLPLDYDDPNGKLVEVALVKVPATDQKHKIGSLFVNPGGPGGSGTQMAAALAGVAGKNVRARFDIVGFDPRGIGFSDQVKCFGDARRQSTGMAGLDLWFPTDDGERAAYLKGAKNLAKGCSTTAKALASSMSTAEAARDMDVLRRAVGDKKLNYLGFSYGSYLGEVYANMFPDRFRALAIDGVIDPQAWAGTSATKNVPTTLRLGSAQGAWKALQEVMTRCDAAGPEYCILSGNAMKRWVRVANYLATHPQWQTDPMTGQSVKFGYAEFIGTDLSMLYTPFAGDIITMDTYFAEQALFAPTQAQRADGLKKLNAQRLELYKRTQAKRGLRAASFTYDNQLDAYSGVLCSDSLNPASAGAWAPAIARAVKNGGGPFAMPWGWSNPQCASNDWKAVDEDAYRGPWNRKTAAPVLVVGSLWDPATSYASAQSAAKRLGNARLLTSDNWGHTAYGAGECATTSIENYLVYGTLPKAGATCTDNLQPFQYKLDGEVEGTEVINDQEVPVNARAGIRMAPKPTIRRAA